MKNISLFKNEIQGSSRCIKDFLIWMRGVGRNGSMFTQVLIFEQSVRVRDTQFIWFRIWEVFINSFISIVSFPALQRLFLSLSKST